jgi:hypothetical protein
MTAIAMILGVGGPRLATLTCLVAVGIAFLAATATERIVDKLDRARARHRAGSELPTSS